MLVTPLIIVQYPPQKEEIIPNSGVLDIVLETTVDLTGPWRKFVERSPLLYGSPIQIKLNVESAPDWCDASIANPTVSLLLDDTEPFQSRLTLTVTEQAPAFHKGTVKISATSVELRGLLFTITEERYDYDISFDVGYWPLISYETEKGTLMEIGPLDTAVFPIKLENLGNGPTEVQIDPMSLYDGGWEVITPSSVVLGTAIDDGTDYEKTVHLEIKPPPLIGTVNKKQDFNIKFSPYYLGNPQLVGNTEILTFTVQVKNDRSADSQNGIGGIIALIVAIIIFIIAMIVFIFLYRDRKYNLK